jgi:hypothetical protein
VIASSGPEEEEAEEQQASASEVDEVVIDPQVRTVIKVAKHLFCTKRIKIHRGISHLVVIVAA